MRLPLLAAAGALALTACASACAEPAPPIPPPPAPSALAPTPPPPSPSIPSTRYDALRRERLDLEHERFELEARRDAQRFCGGGPECAARASNLDTQTLMHQDRAADYDRRARDAARDAQRYVPPPPPPPPR